MAGLKTFRLCTAVISIGLICLQACKKDKSQKVDISSKNYHQAVSAFYQSLAAEQTDHLNYAADQMLQVTRLYPDEPASWADLGVMAFRQGNFDLAQKRLDKARKRAPDNANIEFLIGLMMDRRGDIKQAANHLRKAHQMDPDNMKILYALANELERQDSRANADQIEHTLKQILVKYPQNRVVLIELARVAAKNGNQQELQQAVQKLKQQAGKESQNVLEQLNNVEKAVTAGDTRDTAFELAFLKNELQKRGSFQHEMTAIQPPQNQIGFMITHFLHLPQPTAQIAPADQNLSFESTPVAQNANGQWIKAVSLQGELAPDIISVNSKKVSINGHGSLDFPGGNRASKPGFYAIAVMDYNYDFRNDLVFAGPGGFRLYRQNEDTTFTNVTAQTRLPKPVVNGSYEGAWPADIDSDGDLDIVLAPLDGVPVVLRNNGDNTFKTLKLFGNVKQVVDFGWADLDEDGDPDGIFLSKNGTLTVYLNNRLSDFEQLQTPNLPVQVKTMNVCDLNSDGALDIVVVNAKNDIQRFWYDDQKESWDIAEVARAGEKDNEHLFVHDLDNNGGMDILLSSSAGSEIWLSNKRHQYEKLKTDVPVEVSSVADLSDDQRLDLIGWSNQQQKLVKLINHGTKKYHARIIRPQASGPTRDRRINSFGIGSEVEIRSGLMYQKKLVTSPLVHIGLGTYKKPEMVRIIWPNGLVQAEFSALGNGSIITNEQSLKGSCPWLFTYNGRKMKFLTNVIWNGGLGIRINAQKTGEVMQTDDRIKIGSDQLKAKNGYYDLRITGELWETYYFDKIALMAVDHPDSIHIFVDERFSIPPPDLKVHVTGRPHHVINVLDQNGNNMTSLVSRRDGKYVDRFGHTKYMGLAKKHYVEFDLGNEFPGTGKGSRWLLAYGWMKPTNSSINLAISQGSVPKPKGVSLQVPDGKGGWVTAKSDVGFPAGKNKMVMINLDGIFKDPGDHRIRLSTTTETYWDQIRWACELPDSLVKSRILDPETMKLRYRGYSKVTHADASSPGIPHYDGLQGTTQRWRGQIGFYTRYGDVSELLNQSDNRYVIMSSGDEMRFRFKAPPFSKKNWTRDFVWMGDGWEKDDDYNTVQSQTVLPLPSHNGDGYNKYGKGSLSLKDDPVYQAHKMDWAKYHTRYVTPEVFNHALRVEERH